jgi:UDP-glucuronate decarboxylase
MMYVLITGVAGFLGSHLARHHLQNGDVVWGVDDFSTALGPDAPHFRALMFDRNFHFSHGNIINHSDWSQEEIGGKLSLVYNFACPASPPRYQAMPVHTLMTSVVGTKNMLDVVERHGAILVHASTSEVYGDPTVSPQFESYVGNVNSYGPRSCYDEGKRAAEALCYDYRMQRGVDARLVRIFNTYGPHMDPDDGRVITNFVKQALRGEKLTIYGDGEQSRSFCYVDDLIDGIVKLGQLPENPGTPINVGNPTEFTMNQLASRVLTEVYGEDKIRGVFMFDNITIKPLPIDDPTQRCPDITLAKKLLGWEPKVSLHQGLRKMIPYMRQAMHLE